MSLVTRLADRRDPRSWSAKFRRKRGRHLAMLLAALPRPVKLLDVGGDPVFWNVVGVDDGIEVTIVNIDADAAPHDPRFRFLHADARDLSRLADGSFDVVVSNSVIEHVGGAADQEAMAREVRRVGKRYYVQTPNRWFPIDPHFLVPFFHWMPRRLQIALLTRFDVGWLRSGGDRRAAATLIDSIQLLTERDLRRLFPGARIWRERVLGLTKSLTAYELP